MEQPTDMLDETTPRVPSTRGADGLPRRSWTIEEIERLVDLGVFGGTDRPRERFELIDGEIVPMSPKGIRHERLKVDLNEYWVSRLPAHARLAPETTLRQGPRQFLEPDFVFWPRAVPLENLRSADTLLVVEIAASSRAYDEGPKARLFAEHGVPEYWVIDAWSLETVVMTGPSANGYAERRSRGPRVKLVPKLIPEIAIRLADLGVDPR